MALNEIEQEWQRTKPRGARVTVRLTSGEVFTVVHQLRAMTAEEVDAKFRRLATVAIDPQQSDQLLSLVRSLESVSDVSSLVRKHSVNPFIG